MLNKKKSANQPISGSLSGHCGHIFIIPIYVLKKILQKVFNHLDLIVNLKHTRNIKNS